MDAVNLSTNFSFALESLRQSLTQEQVTAQSLVRQGGKEQGLDAPADTPHVAAPSSDGSRGTVLDISA